MFVKRTTQSLAFDKKIIFTTCNFDYLQVNYPTSCINLLNDAFSIYLKNIKFHSEEMVGNSPTSIQTLKVNKRNCYTSEKSVQSDATSNFCYF